MTAKLSRVVIESTDSEYDTIIYRDEDPNVPLVWIESNGRQISITPDEWAEMRGVIDHMMEDMPSDKPGE